METSVLTQHPVLPWPEGPLGTPVSQDLVTLVGLVGVSVSTVRGFSGAKLTQGTDLMVNVIPHLIRHHLGETVTADGCAALASRKQAKSQLSAERNLANASGLSDQAVFDVNIIMTLDSVDSPKSQAFLATFLSEYDCICLTSVVRVARALILRLIFQPAN